VVARIVNITAFSPRCIWITMSAGRPQIIRFHLTRMF
jgi:hypothetical protein